MSNRSRSQLHVVVDASDAGTLTDTGLEVEVVSLSSPCLDNSLAGRTVSRAESEGELALMRQRSGHRYPLSAGVSYDS